MNQILLTKQVSEKKNVHFMLIAICIGSFVSHFTAGIVNVSLPHLAKIFHVGIGAAQWITTGYLFVIAAFLPLMGKLGDQYGHRHVHNLGYALFTISSVLVAFSPNIYVLLIFRMLQAVGAAMFQATNIALITIHFPVKKRGRALGILGTAVALGGMTGPIVGGFIAQWFQWQWLFLIHVPVILTATLFAYQFIPKEFPEKRTDPFDGLGAFLFALLISFIIFGVSNGNIWGWLSSKMIIIFLLASMTMLLLIWRELSHCSPFLPLRVLCNRAVASGLLISSTSFIVANTILVVMPFYLTSIDEISPLQIGYLMAAYPLALAFSGPIAGNLSDRYGSRVFQFFGLCSMGVGSLVLMSFLGQLSMFGIVGALILIGFGMGLITSPNNSFIMQHVPSEFVGMLGGMIALTRNVGMVLGAALGLGLMNGATQGEALILDASITVFRMNVFIIVVSLMIFWSSILLGKQQKRKSISN
ncbi:MFS transporter [Bacillus chungangensis]|uniref:EmrB/QacA subfamily drug resistance transporter n=1 Tax=Bacillus chungangensis TaxID=587633 RepID=A0ABT9WY75_9BACI|nr:MFS transporter [Bacillus chungangensis]MDQ0178254.1 EmrB/QacA subfamily drug resistance transporter [Bacillus chungangensis]